MPIPMSFHAPQSSAAPHCSLSRSSLNFAALPPPFEMLLRAKLPSAAELLGPKEDTIGKERRKATKQRRRSAGHSTLDESAQMDLPLPLRVETTPERIRPKQLQRSPPEKPPRKFHYLSVQVRSGIALNQRRFLHHGFSVAGI